MSSLQPDRSRRFAHLWRLPKKSLKFIFDGVKIAAFALPNYQSLPPPFPQIEEIFSITFQVSSEFRDPIFLVAFGNIRSVASCVLMPEATMNKHCPSQSKC